MLATAMRRGKILAVHWSDVHPWTANSSLSPSSSTSCATAAPAGAGSSAGPVRPCWSPPSSRSPGRATSPLTSRPNQAAGTAMAPTREPTVTQPSRSRPRIPPPRPPATVRPPTLPRPRPAAPPPIRATATSASGGRVGGQHLAGRLREGPPVIDQRRSEDSPSPGARCRRAAGRHALVNSAPARPGGQPQRRAPGPGRRDAGRLRRRRGGRTAPATGRTVKNTMFGFSAEYGIGKASGTSSAFGLTLTGQQ